jgi:type VI secretion system protein ImpJ
MTARSLYWQDGMLMWPHHMQQEERLHAERIRVNHRLNVHHNWGLRLLDLDPDAFKSGLLRVSRLEARLRDGTLVDVPADGRVATLDLNEILMAHAEVIVYIALAKLHANRPNAMPARSTDSAEAKGAGAAPVETRFLVEAFEVTDENTGTDEQSLSFRTLNLKLLPDAQDLAGYEVLPIGRFVKDAAAGSLPRLDPNYIPPLLACDAWRPLAVDILQASFHQLSGRMDNLANKVLTRGITFETNNPGDNVLLGRLAVLNEATAVLHTIAFAQGIHPLTAYLEMCRLVGQLAVFNAARRAPKLPAYDHDDLGTCYYHVKRLLDELDVDIAPYEESPFVGAALRMQVGLQAKWLELAWQIFVGVASPLPQAEVIRLLTKPGQLDMKIGSADRVDQIFERGLRGLEFTHAAQPPRVLPSMPGLTYFQVNRDAQKSEWDQVQKSLALAIRVNQNRLTLGPAGNLEGQRILELKPQGATAATTMQFTLYLVAGDAKTAAPQA